MMKFRVLRNIFKQGFQGVHRNSGMSLISVLSIGIVLLILGLVLLMVLSINKLVVDTNKTMDQMDVFLNTDLDIDGIKKLADDIEAIGGIESIKFKSKDEGLRELKASWKENAWLLDGYEDRNTLPNSFVVKLFNVGDARVVAQKIQELNGVYQVNFFADEIEQMLKISKYIKVGGLSVVVFLTLVSIFLISNTIKLAVNSRQAEINIMKWVGATNGYIKGPFIVEGVLLGLIAAVIASVVMNFAYKYFYGQAFGNISQLLSNALIEPSLLYKDLTVIFITLGVGIGSVGSLISLKKFLRV